MVKIRLPNDCYWIDERIAIENTIKNKRHLFLLTAQLFKNSAEIRVLVQTRVSTI